MNINLSLSAPSQVETECLVAVVLDQGEKDKPAAVVACSDAAVRDAAKDVIASAEVTGKTFETTLLHRPAGLKAKRLLLVGGGKSKTFSSSDLRKLAGAAVRTLKGKSIRSFAFALPENGAGAAEGVRAVVEGAFVGDFDPDYYKSDRKDQKIDAVTIVARGEQAALDQALNVGRIVGESQTFAVSILSEGQAEIATWFSRSGREPVEAFDEFTTIEWHTGSPIIAGAVAHLDCELESLVPGGDHTIALGRVVGASFDPSLKPLMYYRRGYRKLILD